MRTWRSNRKGFGLPLVILVMFVLVGALAAGFNILSGETAADDSVLQGQAAVAIAETGLQAGLRDRQSHGMAGIPGAGTDSFRVVQAGGYADVFTTMIRPQLDDSTAAIYLVRSRGVRTRTGVAGAGNAESWSSAFATFLPVTMQVQASMTGINGIRKAGSSGIISGHDRCGQKASLPGVAVPLDPGIEGSGQWMNSLDGSQKIDTLGATAEDAADLVPIDWDAIVNEGAIQADFDLPGSGAGFPPMTYFTSDSTRWPTIIVRNGPNPSTEWAIPNWGRGLLIVFGDLNLNGGSAGWNGIILVGGRLRSNGSNEVNGATITGLNEKLGYEVEDNDVNELNGTKQFHYHSCNVAKALNNGGNARLRPYQNTWANNFTSY